MCKNRAEFLKFVYTFLEKQSIFLKSVLNNFKKQDEVWLKWCLWRLRCVLCARFVARMRNIQAHMSARWGALLVRDSTAAVGRTRVCWGRMCAGAVGPRGASDVAMVVGLAAARCGVALCGVVWCVPAA